MSTPQRLSELAKLPSIEITYSAAEEEYGGQVAALMDNLHSSVAEKAKQMTPKEFKWHLVYRRAADPPHITDPKAFAHNLAANSETWLKATGSGWKDYEAISVTPERIMAQYEQRARSICKQRIAAKKAKEIIPEEDDGTDLEQPIAPEGMWNDLLLEALEGWLKVHSHDKRLASVARVALHQLILSEKD